MSPLSLLSELRRGEAIIYLGLELLPSSSEPLFFLACAKSLLLHPSKDLAVAPLCRHRNILGKPRLSGLSAKRVTVRTSILANEGYCPLLLIPCGTRCSDFPPRLSCEKQGNRLPA